MKPEIVVSANPESTGEALAAQVMLLAAQAVSVRGIFTVALSGGSLVKMIAPGLLEHSKKGRVKWPAWNVFWADERCVPLTSPDSNYALAQEHLFRHVPLLETNIYAVAEERGPKGAADAYEARLRSFFAPPPGRFPRFDLILLGMGEDGHTASLFPGHAALEETRRWVLPITDSPKPPPERITLTLPVLNHARNVIFVAAGEGKAAVLKHVLEPGSEDKPLPAARVSPLDGTLRWFVDADAAERLGDTHYEIF